MKLVLQAKILMMGLILSGPAGLYYHPSLHLSECHLLFEEWDL